MRRPHTDAILAALAVAALAGCRGEPSPISPTPAQDPARHARSLREMDEVARRNQQAEARFFRKVRAQSPEPEPAMALAGPSTGHEATVTTAIQESP